MRIRNEELGVRNWLVHTLLVVICFMASMTPAMAQQNSDRISLGFGCLYERGLDVGVFCKRIYQVERVRIVRSCLS